MKVAIVDIVIGTRRREDLGDIEGLAASIRKHGLLHPVVVDDALNLVAGERRIRAYQHLGELEIEVRQFGTLSETERHEIELEENVRRKDLTEYERSRAMVRLAETTKKVLREEAVKQVSPLADSAIRPAGPTAKPDSEVKVAERAGVPRKTIEDARSHVVAVEQYPILADEPKSIAIDYARTIKDFPELSPDQSPGLPPEEVVRVGSMIRAIPEGPARDEAREGASTWHRVYGQPSPQQEARNRPSAFADNGIEKVRDALQLLKRSGGPEAALEDIGEDGIMNGFFANSMGLLREASETLTHWHDVFSQHYRMRVVK